MNQKRLLLFTATKKHTSKYIVYRERLRERFPISTNFRHFPTDGRGGALSSEKELLNNSVAPRCILFCTIFRQEDYQYVARRIVCFGLSLRVYHAR